MHDYKALYLRLFDAISQALASMEENNFGIAWNTLAAAQEEAEELWVREELHEE